jgi:thioester reductase-like protein
MTVMMTGFPGFLASALLPGILRRTDGPAMCLVQSKFAIVTERHVAALYTADPSVEGRIQLVEGDITRPGLGLGAGALNEVTEAWHLAAAYDLSCPVTRPSGSMLTEPETCWTHSSTIRR